MPHPLADIANQSAAFKVQGVAVGTTQLSFNVTSRSGHVISSRSCDLQVYSDLKLSPRVMTLLPGACGQVCTSVCPVMACCCLCDTNVTVLLAKIVVLECA